MKTYSAKPSQIQKKWWVIDAKDLVLGRLASEVAKILRGKHKPSFTPHLDCGDYVIIINSKHICLTGKKSDLKDGKFYYRHTGFPGGIKDTTAGKILSSKYPERVVKLAVKRMITRNVWDKSRWVIYMFMQRINTHIKPSNLSFMILQAKIQRIKNSEL